MLFDNGFSLPALTNLQTDSLLLYLRSFLTSSVNKTSLVIVFAIGMNEQLGTRKHKATQKGLIFQLLFFVLLYHPLCCFMYYRFRFFLYLYKKVFFP